MSWLKTKVWNWWDIAVLKWCCVLFGMLAGAFFHEKVVEYSIFVLTAAVILAVRSICVYWKQ